MHNAPPVVVPVGRFAWGVRMAVVCGVFTALACLLTACVYPLALDRLGALLGAFVLVAALAWVAWQFDAVPPGDLCWDGQSWFFHATGTAAPLSVTVQLDWDGGRVMLLRLCAHRADWPWGRYTWVQASTIPVHWHGLRCAVYGGDTL